MNISYREDDGSNVPLRSVKYVKNEDGITFYGKDRDNNTKVIDFSKNDSGHAYYRTLPDNKYSLQINNNHGSYDIIGTKSAGYFNVLKDFYETCCFKSRKLNPSKLKLYINDKSSRLHHMKTMSEKLVPLLINRGPRQYPTDIVRKVKGYLEDHDN